MSFSRPAIIGGGVMGEAILATLLRSGYKASDITVIEKRAERLLELTEKYQVKGDGIEGSDVVLLAVKPQDVEGSLKVEFRAGTLLVSLLAGVRSSRIEELVPSLRVVRVMPNTPLLISNGMTVVAPGSKATSSDVAWVSELFGKSGKVLVLSESEMDAVTATSGSGPAYLFAFVEAMVAAAEKLGIDKESASVLVSQTLVGAAAMLEKSGKDAKTLRENVTSPKGTTAAALNVFESEKLSEIVYEAMKAARDRSIELSN